MLSPQYLLDTNILSALIKQPAGNVASKILQLDENEFCTSIVVACELRYGAMKKGSAKLIAKVDALLTNIEVMPLDDNVDYHYALLRTALEKRGQPIGAHDMLIAAHALALKTILVTANENEFKRISNLQIENWV